MKMNKRQWGFGGLQLLMVIAVIGAISIIAVPKYNAFITKAKLTEAFNLAGESRKKLSEFYMTNSRFPADAGEAASMKTTTLAPPEYVDHMVVEPRSEDHDVIVKVFLKVDVVDNPSGAEQYVYVAGDRGAGSGFAVEWSCGAKGIDASLLPEDCQG